MIIRDKLAFSGIMIVGESQKEIKEKPIMKNHAKKHIAMLLSVCLILGTLVPIPVVGAGEPTITVTFTPETLSPSSASQRIAMNIYVEPAVDSGVSYKIAYDPDRIYPQLTYAGFFSNEVDILEGYPIVRERVIDITVTPKTTSASHIGTFYFDVPANKIGDYYDFEIREIKVYYNNKSEPYELNDISKTLEVAEGRTAALSGPTEAFIGGDDDSVAYTINVTGSAYQSAELKLAYDSTLLEFDSGANPSIMTAKNGVVTIVQYGANQTPSYTVKFKAIGTGSAKTTLTSAAFGTSETAVSGDLTPAAITGSPVTTVIHQAAFDVTLPKGVTGESTVDYGTNYRFKPTFAESEKYEYTVTATMGGQPTEVTPNDDGTYTISSVIGDLVIIVTKTPKQYTVTFETNTVKAQLHANGTATYGTDYIFELPEESGCTLAVTTASIGGISYDCPAPVDGVVTIPGGDIIGNILINIERVSASVAINGTGAVDAEGAKTAQIGSDYTLTLDKAAGYDYTVTATMDGNAVPLKTGENSYTIETVTGPIVFQVEKTINTGSVNVSEYIKLDGTSVWLVKNKVSKLNGSVYTYNGVEMIWYDAYDAYCCLVISEIEPVISADTLKLVAGTADILAASYDVNQSKKVDANDAQLIYDLYNGHYDDFTKVTMEKFLLADTNQNEKVDTSDAVAVVNYIIQQ